MATKAHKFRVFWLGSLLFILAPLTSVHAAESANDLSAEQLPPARYAQITFTAIEPGDQVTFNPQYVRGTATITFAARDDAAEDEEEPAVEVGEGKDGSQVVAFAAALALGMTAIVQGDEGGEVSVMAGATKPAIVTGGRGTFVFESDQSDPIDNVAVADDPAEEIRADWIASRTGSHGKIEAAYDVSSLPHDACTSGKINFVTHTEAGHKRDISHSAVCVNYELKEITRVGQTEPLRAKILGLDEDESVSFAFIPDNARMSVNPVTRKMTVGEINRGEPLTYFTGKVPGSHTFGATVKVLGIADTEQDSGTCRCLLDSPLKVREKCTEEKKGAKNTGTATGTCRGTNPKCPIGTACTVTEEVVCRGDHWQPTGEKRSDTCRDALAQEEKPAKPDEKPAKPDEKPTEPEEQPAKPEDKKEEEPKKKRCGRVNFTNPPIITGVGDVEDIARDDFFTRAIKECRAVCSKRTELCEKGQKCQLAFIIADEPPAGCAGGELVPEGRKPVRCEGILRGCQCECRL